MNQKMIEQQECERRISAVAAGVVTFNPDIERLEENLRAIIPQVSHLFIYDNGSANEEAISTLVSGLNCSSDIHFAKDNTGMAKALNGLARAAKEKGFDHLLLLDQDSVSSPDMVKTLLRFASDDVALISPHICDRNVTQPDNYEPEVLPIRKVITSGALLNLAIHEEVGGYDERLFVDLVDDEFCYCVRSHGYTVLKCNYTYISHELGQKEKALPILKRKEGEGIKVVYLYRSNHALWRRKDIGRSAAIILNTYKGNPLHHRIVLSLGKYFVFALILERKKFAVARESLRGFREGRKVAKRFKRSLPPGDSVGIPL